MDNNKYDNNFVFVEGLKTVVDFSRNGVLIINLNAEIIYINDWAAKFLGIERIGDMLHKKTTIFFPSSRLVKVMESGIEQRNVLDVRLNKHLVVSRLPIFSDNKIIGAVAIFQGVKEVQDNEMEIRKTLIEKGLTAKYSFEDILYKSKLMEKIVKTAKIYSETDLPVLITGESGTGKELFAQSIHKNSSRRSAPFLAINCAALSESVFEAELFGYAEASFTGAQKGGKKGLFQQAHRGTIFLDEIGELPISVQSKLLRVLEEKQVHPVGSDTLINIDVRVIVATNRDLIDEAEKGNFRLDLLHRLNTLTLSIPPLRYRLEDVEVLARYFLSEKYPKLYNENKIIVQQLLEQLKNHSLMGNVRELKNIIERFAILLNGGMISEDIDEVMRQVIYQTHSNTNTNIAMQLEKEEVETIKNALISTKGNRSEAAKILGISESTLWRRIKKFNISTKF